MTNALAKKPKGGELVGYGDRSIATSGFRVELAIEHLKAHLEIGKPWCSIDCLTRVFCGGRTSRAGRKQMRRRVTGLFKTSLEQGLLLAIERGKHNKTLAVSLVTNQIETQKQAIQEQLARMRDRCEISETNYIEAQNLFEQLFGAAAMEESNGKNYGYENSETHQGC